MWASFENSPEGANVRSSLRTDLMVFGGAVFLLLMVGDSGDHKRVAMVVNLQAGVGLKFPCEACPHGGPGPRFQTKFPL